MPPQNEHLEPLPADHRHGLFLTMVLVFAIAVPVTVFYAVGYRYDFFDATQAIKAVGGMYISSEVENGNIYVNDELVDDVRIFRSAAYIQNLEEGTHEVYVESSGYHTWVKELPVFAHLVTEAQTFNMPVRPQVRLLSEWNNAAGIGVLFDPATSTHFTFASTTNRLELATTTATSTLNRNLEYDYIASRFASSSEEAALLELYEQKRTQRFSFATATNTVPTTTTATTTKFYRDMRLYQHAEDVYATWEGESDEIPYYFCMTHKGSNLTAQLYGSHAYDQLVDQMPSTTAAIDWLNTRVCRETIRIDRKHQEVHWFDFMPDNEHLVLMHLGDGLHVVEIDDRAWQNTQLLYPGENIEVLIDGGRVFVHDGDYYLQVLTEIAQ